jgi:hypothetical protein
MRAIIGTVQRWGEIGSEVSCFECFMLMPAYSSSQSLEA